jgi:hypothetical protein
VYSRPWHIVYGTPQLQTLRYAMRDLAMYIANSHLAAHDTHVRVLSDLEYRAGGFGSEKVDYLANLLIIGGPTVNKVMRKVCKSVSVAASSQHATRSTLGRELSCRSPVDFVIQGHDLEDIDAELSHISIGPHNISMGDQSADVAALFTFPVGRIRQHHAQGLAHTKISVDVNSQGNVLNDLLRSASTPAAAKTQAGIALCLHATSPQGFLHLSRLAWPVIPPMVRSPFANYIPDFMVIDGRVWRDGFGAVRLAGFWNATWGYDPENAFYQGR